MSETKKRTKSASRIPTFATREEEAEFWDTHDFTDYWDQFKPADVTFNVEPSENVTVWIDGHTMKRVRAEAEKQGLPPDTLIFIWILERFQNEDRAASDAPKTTSEG